jgi:acetyltransferase-like isoleucine patch superfamily enzyme
MNILKYIVYIISKICYLIVKGSDYYKINHRNFIADIAPSSKISPDTIIQNPSSDRANIKIGNRCIITDAELVLFGHGGKIVIGDSCFIGKGTRIWSGKRITIGNNVLISHNVNIHDNGSHPLNSLERQDDFNIFYQTGKLREANNYDLREAEVRICDNAWLGFNSTVAKGVTIGQGAIVGAYSFVTKDVPDYAVVVGNPARIIKYTD